MTGADSVRAPRVRLPMLLVGLFLVAAFHGLDATSNTTRVSFIPPWDASTRGELYFWLGALLFLLPGATLIGASMGELARPTLERMQRGLAATSARERVALCLCLAVIAYTFARIGNQVILLGQPFTDDEDAARFGGQVLASGSLWAPLPPLRFAFPELFLFQLDGRWTSFDFLGALLPWSFAELTGTDTWIFSLLACLAPLGVALACTRAHGPGRGLIAGGLMLCSPMAATLSMTSHTHVVSRGMLGLGLGILLFVEEASFGRAAVAGLAFGAAFATRPAETAMLLAPLSLCWTYEALQTRAQRPRWLGLLCGLLPGVLALVVYDYALTGTLGFPRSFPNEIRVPYGGAMRGPFDWSRWGPRFGNNLSYNLLTLSIWFLGPLGLLLAYLGARTSRTHALLGMGALLGLFVTMLHDDRGLHMVGPIHLSELALPLSVLATAGLTPLLAFLERNGVPRSQGCTALLGYAVLGFGIFFGRHTVALHQQATTRVHTTAMVEDVPQRPAVVLVGPYAKVRSKYADPDRTGSFVYEWRRARPDLAEPVLLLHDSKEARQQVRAAFPDRAAFVFAPSEGTPMLRPVASLVETPP